MTHISKYFALAFTIFAFTAPPSHGKQTTHELASCGDCFAYCDTDRTGRPKLACQNFCGAVMVKGRSMTCNTAKNWEKLELAQPLVIEKPDKGALEHQKGWVELQKK